MYVCIYVSMHLGVYVYRSQERSMAVRIDDLLDGDGEQKEWRKMVRREGYHNIHIHIHIYIYIYICTYTNGDIYIYIYILYV